MRVGIATEQPVLHLQERGERKREKRRRRGGERGGEGIGWSNERGGTRTNTMFLTPYMYM